MAKKTKKINPVIKPVIDTFQMVYYQTMTFAKNPNSAINGLIVMGDAGTGKSHYVKTALRDAGVQKNVEFIKGGTITAPSLYVKLWLNRQAHRIMVLDDVDIIGHPDKNKIVPMILGAVEEGRNRKVTWSTATKNQLMKEHGIGNEFEFNGKVIIITNYTHQHIQDKFKQYSQAFKSRFNDAECIFTHEQKYLYTKYLIEDGDMLGQACRVHQYEAMGRKIPGYPPKIIRKTESFIDDNYQNFSDISPRLAIKIADTLHYYRGQQLQVMLQALVR